jgi:hypothetical protein
MRETQGYIEVTESVRFSVFNVYQHEPFCWEHDGQGKTAQTFRV